MARGTVARRAGREHRTLHDAARHLGWDRDQPPALEVAPGDVLELELRDAGDEQIGPASTAEAVARLDPERANPLTGPVRIDGALPGDALEVEILEVAPAQHGWTALIPGFGLLADEFPEPFLQHSHRRDTHVVFAPGIELPVRAFPGTLGLAPAEPGRHGSIPPRAVGGNLDVPDLVAGSRLLLPVAVSGALLSAGDAHACQGRGEVCGTAVETSARLTVRVSLERGLGLQRPRLVLPEAPPPVRGRRQVTLGIADDLRDAARQAVGDLIEQLVRQHGLSPELAYCLCSVAADLAIEELVNAPHWVVSATLPEAVFR